MFFLSIWTVYHEHSHPFQLSPVIIVHCAITFSSSFPLLLLSSSSSSLACSSPSDTGQSHWFRHQCHCHCGLCSSCWCTLSQCHIWFSIQVRWPLHPVGRQPQPLILVSNSPSPNSGGANRIEVSATFSLRGGSSQKTLLFSTQANEQRLQMITQPQLSAQTISMLLVRVSNVVQYILIWNNYLSPPQEGSVMIVVTTRSSSRTISGTFRRTENVNTHL